MKGYVFITGAAGGLGKAFAVECASRGWNLFLTDLSQDALSKIAVSLTNTYGVEVITEACDLTEPASRLSLFDSIKEKNLNFRCLVNVAGVDHEGPFFEKTRDQIRNIIRVNIEATLDITRGILEFRSSNTPFRLVNVSSLASFYPMPVKATYAASKRFLLDFSLALREELKPLGGTVTVLCPGGLPTTKEAIMAIDAQGFLGRITTKNVGYVAARTIDHALKGHAVYIPGIFNKILQFTCSIVPPGIAAYFLCKRWMRSYRKWSGHKPYHARSEDGAYHSRGCVPLENN